MNAIDRMLSKTPDSDDSWHCPWFRVIVGLCVNGGGFGFIAYLAYNASLGLVAFAIALGTCCFTMGSRSRHDSTC